MFVSLSSPMMNADGGGGGGPVASPFTQGGGRGGSGHQGGGESGGDLLAELQAEIQLANRRAAQADERSQGLAGIVGGIKKAVSGGESEQEQDWYEDQLLPHLLQLEKDGKSHPMTATLARELRKSQEQQQQLVELARSLKEELAEMKNPQVQNDERAFSTIDDSIIEELTSIYGEHSVPMHRAVAANIAADIQRIKTELPGKWEEIRRDQKKLQRIVKHHISAVIPPVARQAIAKQIEDNTPVTMQTLNAAWGEFQQIKDKLDPQTRSEMATELRRQILAEKFAESRRMPRR